MVFVKHSVPPVAAWRHDRGEPIEVEFDDSLQGFGGGGVAQALRQCLPPGGVFRLQRDQFADGVSPALWPCSAVGRTSIADHRRRLFGRVPVAIDLMSVFGPGNRVKGNKARLCRGPTKGAAQGTSGLVFAAA